MYVVLSVVVALLGLPAVPSYAEDPPSITLTADRAVYTYGQSARFSAVVHAMNLDYYFQVQYAGQTQWRQVNYRGNVNDDVVESTLSAYVNMKVRALLVDNKGTSDPADDTVSVEVARSVPVRARISTAPSGYYTKSGSYALMSKYAAKFRSQSAPAYPGKRCLRHQVQRKYASGWKLVKTSACIVEGKQGVVDWKWTGTHPSRVNFRVRATFAGDTFNRANAGAWVYFRFR